jgi:hypothetical protein
MHHSYAYHIGKEYGEFMISKKWNKCKIYRNQSRAAQNSPNYGMIKKLIVHCYNVTQ